MCGVRKGSPQEEAGRDRKKRAKQANLEEKRECIYLRTLCGTRPKQYPLNSKLPCFFARKRLRNRVSVTSESLPMGAIHRTLAFFYVSLLGSFFAVSPGFLLDAASSNTAHLMVPARTSIRGFPFLSAQR